MHKNRRLADVAIKEYSRANGGVIPAISWGDGVTIQFEGCEPVRIPQAVLTRARGSGMKPFLRLIHKTIASAKMVKSGATL